MNTSREMDKSKLAGYVYEGFVKNVTILLKLMFLKLTILFFMKMKFLILFMIFQIMI